MQTLVAMKVDVTPTSLVSHLAAMRDVQRGGNVGWCYIHWTRFTYLSLQNKWEIRFWPKADWNLSPSAKFGLEPNSFLLSFCIGKQPAESLKHGSGNWDVCSLPISDPDLLCDFGWVTALLWFISWRVKLVQWNLHVLLEYSKNDL